MNTFVERLNLFSRLQSTYSPALCTFACISASLIVNPKSTPPKWCIQPHPLHPPPPSLGSLTCFLSFFRHLDATKRPSFMELSRQLSLPDSKLLQWEECDKFLNPHVNKLGANPQYANELYMDIQRRYQKVPP